MKDSIEDIFKPTVERWKPNMKRDPNDLAEWYPIIKDIVPTPKTEIVDVRDIHLLPIIDGQNEKELTIAIDRVFKAIDKIRLPCFFRTGLTSAKHSWKDSCYLTERSQVAQRIFNLMEFSAIHDIFGPSIDIDTLAVREILDTNPIFCAFRGEMPVTKEFRIFVENEKVIYIQPYWPEDVFEGYVDDNIDWKSKIKYLQKVDESIINMFKTWSIKINKKIPGYWSIDWLYTAYDTWYVIDMARGEESYKYEYDQSKFKIKK